MIMRLGLDICSAPTFLRLLLFPACVSTHIRVLVHHSPEVTTETRQPGKPHSQLNIKFVPNPNTSFDVNPSQTHSQELVIHVTGWCTSALVTEFRGLMKRFPRGTILVTTQRSRAQLRLGFWILRFVMCACITLEGSSTISWV